MKPVALIERAICNSSRRGDLVLDPFGGSGSTLIACEKTGRATRLMELEPQYVDVTMRRWEAYSGQEARLESSGQSFAAAADERLRRQSREMHGRPFERGNKIGKGRPRGSRNQRTVFAEMMDSHGEALIKQCQVMALKGDRPDDQ